MHSMMLIILLLCISFSLDSVHPTPGAVSSLSLNTLLCVSLSVCV